MEVAWDYLMAVKSYVVVRWIERCQVRVSETPKVRPSTVALTICIVLDLWLTAVVTAGFLNWSDMFQSQHAANIGRSIPTLAQAVSGFFDTVDLVMIDSVQNSFYILNGSLIMYGAFLLAALSSGAGKYMNSCETQKHLFKILGSFTIFVLFVVLVCYQLAS